jgi:hypothetical protein
MSFSANGELSAFVSLLRGLINRNAVPLPTIHTPVPAKDLSKQVKSNEVKSTEVKSEKQSSAPERLVIVSTPPVLLEGPQFTQIASQRNEPPDQAKGSKQSGPAMSKSETAAPRSVSFQGTIDACLIAPDVAFGVHLTNNQPPTENPGRASSGPLAADLAPTPDGAYVAQAPPDLSNGGVASPSTRPHAEVAEVLAGDGGTISQDFQPMPRPETAHPRTTAPEQAISPTPQQPGTGDGDKGSSNAETERRDSARSAAPKPNQAILARADVHLQTSPGTLDVSARQFDLARVAEPPSSRTPTNPSDLRSDLRRVASGHEINPTVQPQAARQISLKLTGPDSTKVDLQLTERSGKMQITVRTPDHALAKSMQSDLSELVGRLENKGFKAEAWIPASGRHAEAAAVPQQSSQGNSQNPAERQSGGSGSPPQQQRQGQNESNQRRQARWKTQLEEIFPVEDKRMENIQ